MYVLFIPIYSIHSLPSTVGDTRFVNTGYSGARSVKHKIRLENTPICSGLISMERVVEVGLFSPKNAVIGHSSWFLSVLTGSQFLQREPQRSIRGLIPSGVGAE